MCLMERDGGQDVIQNIVSRTPRVNKGNRLVMWRSEFNSLFFMTQ